MERTQANPVGTAPFEAHKVAHHVNNVGGVENLLYCIVVNHIELVVIEGLGLSSTQHLGLALDLQPSRREVSVQQHHL